MGLAGKRWEIGRYADVKGSGYEGHEFTRHKVLKEMGCGDERNAGDSVHNLKASLAKKHLGVGRNEFQTNVDGTPTKRQMDIWQGALRKAGVPPSQVKKLRQESEEYIKSLKC